MRLRYLLIPLILVISGCATTAVEPVTNPVTESAALPGDPPHSSTETIDEHLFVPELQEVTTTHVEEQHVHTGVWERLTHSYMLPE